MAGRVRIITRPDIKHYRQSRGKEQRELNSTPSFVIIIKPAEIIHSKVDKRITCIDHRTIVQPDHVSGLSGPHLFFKLTEGICDGAHPLAAMHYLAALNVWLKQSCVRCPYPGSVPDHPGLLIWF